MSHLDNLEDRRMRRARRNGGKYSAPAKPAPEDPRLSAIRAALEAAAKVASDHTPKKHESTLAAFVTGDMIERAIRNLSPDDILKRL